MPREKFQIAFDQFKANGTFTLESTNLSTNEITQLNTYLFPPRNPNIPYYQFRLENVTLVPSPTPAPQEETVKKKDKLPTVSGSVIEHRISWHENSPDVSIVNFGSSPGNNGVLSMADQERRRALALETELHPEDEIAQALITLLSQRNTWEAIQLDGVTIQIMENGNSTCLSTNFYHRLLDNLAQHNSNLTELSLQPASFYSFHNTLLNTLIKVLEQNPKLGILRLQTTDINKEDWDKLSQTLAKHPKITHLDLAQTSLDIDAYNALSKLLSENYRIERIDLPEPNDVVIREDGKLRQRLSIPGRERFKQEQLTQDKLIEIAIDALKKGNHPCFSVLLSEQFQSRMIMPDEIQTWKKQACQELPPVYGAHPNYVEHYSSDFQLDLQRPKKEGEENTVGYYLLALAFDSKDSHSIERLIKLGANVLEHPPAGTPSLIKKFFLNLNEENSKWTNTVAERLQQNLISLVPSMTQLSPFIEVDSGLNDIKSHLDRYLKKLIDRTGSPLFLKLMYRAFFHFEERKQDWETALGTLVDMTIAGTKETEVTYETMKALQEFIQILLINANNATRGILGRSELNDELTRLGFKLNEKARACADKIHLYEVAQAAEKERQKNLQEMERMRTEIERMRTAMERMEQEAEQMRQAAPNNPEAAQEPANEGNNRPNFFRP